MANPLTGDFEAVLQVSGSTVNRLLATIHQNGGQKTTLPGFTHGTQIRIGDPHAIDGMRGLLKFQVGAPQIDLIHGATDRFWLEVPVRGRYKPDPGTVPIPEFIHGRLRAQYRIDNIDPTCVGWSKLSPEYLWIRVIADTVSFTGTAEDDAPDFVTIGAAIDAATADARITRVARVLLRTRFEATPHKVSRRFRKGSMRSLHVGAHGSLVTAPIGLTVDPPPGDINSINQDLLDGRDFGVAVTREYIMGLVSQQLDAIKASASTTLRLYHRTYVDVGWFGDVDLLVVTIDYSIKLTSVSAQWLGGMIPFPGITVPGGLILITMTGQARTQKAIFNFDVEASQFVVVSFDAAQEEFTAAPFGPADVKLTGTFAPLAEPYAKPYIQTFIANALSGAGALGGALSLTARKNELIKQLTTIDEHANAWFDEAVFTPDGLIVRGRIAVSSRRAPAAAIAITPEQDGYTGFDSWIPGGRIDSFTWTWTWFNNAGQPGSETRTDRFILRRPVGGGRGKFGVMLGLHRPLPGLDGMGRVCLAINGVHVHPVTGALVPVSTTVKCMRFGLDIRLATPGRVFLREWVPGPRDPIGPVAEVAVHEVAGPRAQGHGANTLVVRVGEAWDRDVARSVRDGLASCQRRDAGLVVLVLLRDGTLVRSGPEVLNEFNELVAELEAPLVVNEDVRGSWSTALRLDGDGPEAGGLEWRLITPTGGVTWAHSGRIDPRELGTALDAYLFRSPVADIVQVNPGLPMGTRMSSLEIDPGYIDQLIELDSPCPPPPFGRFDVNAAVTFVMKNSAASEAALRKLKKDYESRETEMFAAVVIDGVDSGDIEWARRSLPDSIMTIPDPDGTIAKRFGVRVWPSHVTVDETGFVTGFDMGVDPALVARSSDEEAS